MESVYFINLIFIFVLNVFFFFSGVCLNSVVIISTWRSVQLRKKLCYFMIMILSCCDLVAVVTNNPLVAAIAILWATEKIDMNARWVFLSARLTTAFLTFSLLALFVVNFDRYLATSYPIFHRTSVTKRRLLALLGILIIMEIILAMISVVEPIISFEVHTLIIFALLSPPMLFMNYKLFMVARKSREKKRLSPDLEKTFSLKSISSCLLVVICYVLLAIPSFVCIGIRMSPVSPVALDNANLAEVWAKTIISMNCSFNCLIFYWKNKVLRTEGWKVIKSLKINRRFQS